MGKTNGKAISELAENYSKAVLAQAGIVALGRFIIETMKLPENMAFTIAQMAYERELKEMGYLFATLADEVK